MSHGSPSPDDRYERGVEQMKHNLGDEATAAAVTGLTAVSPSFAQYSIGSTYGDVFTREGLDLKARQMVTIAIVATLGGLEPQLRVHVAAGLRLGLTPEEIVETIVQVSAYAGAPRASWAFGITGQVFAEQRVKVR